MQKVLMLKGLPASGKSTWSRAYCEKNTDWVRVNRDDLRRMRGKYWIPKQENIISSMERACLYAALNHGKHVIVDATNLNPKRENAVRQWIKDWERDYEARNGQSIRIAVETKVFNVPVLECIKRDLKRPESVGKEVIMMMYDNYLRPRAERVIQNPNLPHVILCDLDGTVCIHNGRSPYDVDKCDTDLPNGPVISIVENYLSYGQGDVIFMSGREDKCREKSAQWLRTYMQLEDSEARLLMRQTGDNRKDAIVKAELFNTYIKDTYYVDFILDDRDQVVEMWREMGLTCLQVAEGNF